MTRKFRLCALVAVMFVAAGISGCGQKGPLFWPQDKLDELEKKREERKTDKAPAKTSRLAPSSAAVPTA